MIFWELPLETVAIFERMKCIISFTPIYQCAPYHLSYMCLILKLETVSYGYCFKSVSVRVWRVIQLHSVEFCFLESRA